MERHKAQLAELERQRLLLELKQQEQERLR